jgi:hypothetical protein
MGFIADEPIHSNVDITADETGKRSVYYTTAFGIKLLLGEHIIGARYTHNGQEFTVEPTGVVSVREIMVGFTDGWREAMRASDDGMAEPRRRVSQEEAAIPLHLLGFLH